ncbi:YhcN/YlaJ family sporulation lipoprotein [Tuberibacillus sp. Marseille-P3662]|uniref:YhcN/YlaJ family sporulation lipoprotein n=1 Tax=Tuberibacillus sp. Marseille-P3662 TaxID=1965358 RepID=UPI000A1CCC44|nr:YhcN/YlaJ family sporulation lipoprotein [Tuberibacillus sp. Marseille-P3662]
MKKQIGSLAAAFLLSINLTGCNGTTTNDSEIGANNNNIRQIGYNTEKNNTDNPLNEDTGVDNNTRDNHLDANDFDTHAAQQIEKRVSNMDNVKSARVIVTDANVLIGINTHHSITNKFKADIRSTISDQINDHQDIHIMMDEAILDRIHTMDDALKNNENRSGVQENLDRLGDDAETP